MSYISKSLRFEILTRDGFRCRYCGVDSAQAQLQIDHVVPRALGGDDDAMNLVTACRDCNYGKADRKIIELPDGFALSKDKRPGRLEKARRGAIAHLSSTNEHVLDCYNIDQLDEIDEDNQLVSVWCVTHEKYEWMSVPRSMVRNGGTYRTKKKEISW